MGETALLDGFWGIVGASIDTRCICINAKATLYCSTIAQA